MFSLRARLETWRARLVGAVCVRLGAVLFGLPLGCASPLSELECQALLARYTELLVVNEQRHAKPRTIEEAKLRALRAAEDDPRWQFEECSAHVRRSQLECAERAPDVDAFELCLTF